MQCGVFNVLCQLWAPEVGLADEWLRAEVGHASAGKEMRCRPHGWQVRLPLSWQTGRQVTQFLLTSAAEFPAHGRHSRPSCLPAS